MGITKTQLMRISGIGEATALKILEAIEKGTPLTEVVGKSVAKKIEKLRETNSWERVSDMRVINFLKKQVKGLRGMLTNRINGNVEIDNQRFFFSTYKGKKENTYISAVYLKDGVKKDGKDKWVKQPYFLLSYTNEENDFLTVGKINATE